MITYIAYISLFLVIYYLVKKGFEEFTYDLMIVLAHFIALIIRLYFKIKKWTKRIIN